VLVTRTRIFREDAASEADRTIQRELLERLSPMHREVVSFSLDLPRKSSARQIAATFKDNTRLEEILDELSSTARELLLRGVFDETGEVLTLDELDLSISSWKREARTAVGELERRGLVFAFLIERELVYHVPADFRVLLRRALMARYASSVRPGSAERWLAAERQDLRDAVALWTLLARDPVPLTAVAEIKANSKPRMLAALPAITFPYPDDTLTQRRLTIALGYLRDNAHLRVHADEHDPHRPKLRLGVTGDLAATLAKDTTTNTTTTGCANYREEEQALCARALGEALAGQSVSLVSFGRVLHGLIGDAIGRYTEHPPPQALPLYGLLPGWLRGELQIGSSRGKPTAIRFIPSQRSSAQQACALANQLCETHSVKDHCQTDESTERGPDDITYGTRYKWCAREPLHFIGGLGSFEQPDLTSTLGSSAHAVRIPQL
jgi:hypothetical protein